MEQSHRRMFSIEEATNLVPFLSESFREIFRTNDQIKTLKTGADDLLAIWGDEVKDTGHVDFELYSERKEKLGKLMRKVQKILDNIENTGAIIKDINVGMVDFYSRDSGSVIMLCWKFGEKNVAFWHPISRESVKRKPISELRI